VVGVGVVRVVGAEVCEDDVVPVLARVVSGAVWVRVVVVRDVGEACVRLVVVVRDVAAVCVTVVVVRDAGGVCDSVVVVRVFEVVCVVVVVRDVVALCVTVVVMRVEAVRVVVVLRRAGGMCADVDVAPVADTAPPVDVVGMTSVWVLPKKSTPVRGWRVVVVAFSGTVVFARPADGRGEAVPPQAASSPAAATMPSGTMRVVLRIGTP
jgi:hypothetical protein